MMTEAFAIVDPGAAAAFLSGHKTQMRVLTQSPLARLTQGDRISLREACIAGRYVDGQVYATSRARAEFVIFADGWRQHRDGSAIRGRRPTDPDHAWITAIQMPQWAARMTLLVKWVWVERLRQITRGDIRAEGIGAFAGGLLWRGPGRVPGLCWSARRAFAHYWDTRHSAPGERWEDDPQVVVLGVSLEPAPHEAGRLP